MKGVSCLNCAPLLLLFGGAFAGVGVGRSHGHPFWWVIPDALTGAALGLIIYFVGLFFLALVLWLLDKSQGGTTSLFPPRKK